MFIEKNVFEEMLPIYVDCNFLKVIQKHTFSRNWGNLDTKPEGSPVLQTVIPSLSGSSLAVCERAMRGLLHRLPILNSV